MCSFLEGVANIGWPPAKVLLSFSLAEQLHGVVGATPTPSQHPPLPPMAQNPKPTLKVDDLLLQSASLLTTPVLLVTQKHLFLNVLPKQRCTLDSATLFYF